MNRRSILGISAMTALGLALLPGSTVAQQGTLNSNWSGLGRSFRRRTRPRMAPSSGLQIREAS